MLFVTKFVGTIRMCWCQSCKFSYAKRNETMIHFHLWFIVPYHWAGYGRASLHPCTSFAPVQTQTLGGASERIYQMRQSMKCIHSFFCSHVEHTHTHMLFDRCFRLVLLLHRPSFSSFIGRPRWQVGYIRIQVITKWRITLLHAWPAHESIDDIRMQKRSNILFIITGAALHWHLDFVAINLYMLCAE